ncbi:MAG: LCP family protein [Butyrivibrio sp.]|nr:LCP family protein [Butyrivibrio sp.]
MKKESRKKKKLGMRIVIGIASTVLVLVLVIGLAGIVFYKSGEAALRASAENKIPIMETDPEEIEKARESFAYGSSVAWQDEWVVYEDNVYEYNEDTLNFLLLGIDHDGELDKETDLSDWGAGQADAIFLASANQKNKTVSIIGIPRNTMVELDIYNEDEQRIDSIYNQICLQYGYAGGGELGLATMKESVSELLYNLPIHGVCAVSYDAIGVVVDMIGGVEVTIPDDMTAYNPQYTEGSRLLLTKKNVMPYLRYRDMETLGSPTIRLSRQKGFLKEAISQTISKVKSNPRLVSDIYQAIVPYMNTDITLDEAVYLAAEFVNYRIEEDSFYQLTGEDKQVDYVNVSGGIDFFDDLYIDEDAKRRLVMKLFYDEVVVQ